MDAAAFVKVLGGLGLFLLGIHHLTEGLKSLAGDSLRRALQTLVSSRFSAVVSGALFTVAIQSSTATILTVIGFVSAGLVTFSQAIAITIGATLGTTSTPWLVAVFGFRLRIAPPDRNRPRAPSCGWSPEAGCDRVARSSRVSDCSSWGSTTSRWA